MTREDVASNIMARAVDATPALVDTLVMTIILVLIAALAVIATIVVFDLRRRPKIKGSVKDTRSIERTTRDARRDAAAHRSTSRGPTGM